MSYSMDDSKLLRGRRRVLFGLAAAAGFAATARTVPAWSASVDAAPAWPLWSVEGKGSKVYLFGETPPRVHDWHDARIEGLLPECSALWTETSHKHRADMQSLLTRFATVPNKPLSSWLTKEDETRLAKAAEYCHVPLDSLATYRPWAAGASLQDTYYQVAGLSDKSADRVLVAQAEKAGMATSSEFAMQDDVFAWFSTMTPAQDVQFLRYALDEILAGPTEGERIYSDWSLGRVDRATAIVNAMTEHYPELVKKIVVERNRNWIPRFNAMLDNKKPAMTVVGLYHLVGPESLLVQLKRSGLVVRRI